MVEHCDSNRQMIVDTYVHNSYEAEFAQSSTPALEALVQVRLQSFLCYWKWYGLYICILEFTMSSDVFKRCPSYVTTKTVNLFVALESLLYVKFKI